ncbi:MAG: TIGR03617 family F420-dependent LLM class oxidoreductase [Pseudonocardia sp.]
MKVDLMLDELFGEEQWAAAERAERDGYDGVWAGETRHDPFPGLAVAAARTSRVQLGTAVALAFARNPMSLAVLADDLQRYSRGRFVLGVGSQIRTHVVGRYSMPWSAPAERMREFLLAVRAIWASWATGERLRFRGEHYRHTVMTPMFDPGPNPHGNPPILLAGVGPRMTAVAGDVADGLFVHGFTTRRYLREVTLPQLASARGGSLHGFEISGMPFVVTGPDPAAITAADAAVRERIAFYGSTPAYRRVLELHGWAALGDELHALSRRGRWREMGTLISDEVLDAFAVVAAPDAVAGALRARFGGLCTRIAPYAPYPLPDGFWAPIVAELKG